MRRNIKKKMEIEHSIRLEQAFFTRDQHKFICSCGFIVVAYSIDDAREVHVLVLHDLERKKEKKERLVN